MYFIDVQGTLIDDIERKPIDGSIEMIEYFNSVSMPYVVITNNTKHTSEDFLSYLKSQGLNINEKYYLDPLMMLQSRVQEKNIAAYGSDEFLKILTQMGYTLDFESPSAVIVSIKESFQSSEFAQMCEFLLGGAKLIGMHETALYAKNNRRYPGVGAILKMLSFATSKEYEVIGKPSSLFYKKALEMLDESDFKKITIISDDIKGDLVGAMDLGMKAIFVLSGKFKSADEVQSIIDEHKDALHVYKNIKQINEEVLKI